VELLEHLVAVGENSHPDKGEQFHRHVRLFGLDHDRLQALGRGVARGIKGRGLGAQLLVELTPLLLDRRDRFLRALDVLGLFHRAPDASCRGRRTADGAGVDRLPSEQRPDQCRTDGDGRLQLLTGGLFALTFDHLAGAAQLVFERGLTRGEGDWLQNLVASPENGRFTDFASFKTLKMPVLIIWGRDDTVTPLWQGEALQPLFADARLSVIPDCGHIPYIEQTGAFNDRLVEFLESK